MINFVEVHAYMFLRVLNILFLFFILYVCYQIFSINRKSID